MDILLKVASHFITNQINSELFKAAYVHVNYIPITVDMVLINSWQKYAHDIHCHGNHCHGNHCHDNQLTVRGMILLANISQTTHHSIHSVFITNEYKYEANNKLTGKQCAVECLCVCWLLLCHSGLHQPGNLLLSADRSCMRTRNESVGSEYAVFKVDPKLQYSSQGSFPLHHQSNKLRTVNSLHAEIIYTFQFGNAEIA